MNPLTTLIAGLEQQIVSQNTPPAPKQSDLAKQTFQPYQAALETDPAQPQAQGAPPMQGGNPLWMMFLSALPLKR